MGRYIAMRFASAAALLVGSTLIIFVLFSLIPVQAPRQPIGDDTFREKGSVSHQYIHYMWNIVRHGDFGHSFATREAVTTLLERAAPITLSVVLGGLLVWLLIAIPLGFLAALRPRSRVDRAGSVFALIGMCAHPLWLGL